VSSELPEAAWESDFGAPEVGDVLKAGKVDDLAGLALKSGQARVVRASGGLGRRPAPTETCFLCAAQQLPILRVSRIMGQ
jgi:hypothetical protein